MSSQRILPAVALGLALATLCACAPQMDDGDESPQAGATTAFGVNGVGNTAVFFVDLYKPWYYFWMFGGAVMRLIICLKDVRVQEAAPLEATRLAAGRRDPHGWAHPVQTGGGRL
jgi:hypothetical protein